MTEQLQIVITDKIVREVFIAMDYYSGFSPVISKDVLQSALTGVFSQCLQRQEST